MIEAFCKQLKPFQYISFDVFDTLIFRSVSDSKMIFDMVKMVYQSRYEIQYSDFTIKRSYAESNARSRLDKDVSIDEIYDFIDYPFDISQKLKQIEKECEIVNCIPNQVMIDIFHWCQNEGKVIIITSDMYLTKDVFDSIFKKIGLQYDYLYISGEVGLTKKSGKLFDYILNDLHIKGEQIAHIGDDEINDIAMPLVYGIKSFYRLLKPAYEKYYLKLNTHSIEEDHLFTLFKNRSRDIDKSVDSEYRIGYTVFGPFLYEFCRWIHQVKMQEGLDKLFFLARDGFLVKKIYDIIYPEDANDCSYICLNKNILRLPSLDGNNKIERLILSLPPRKEYSWKDLFSHLSIDINSLHIDELNSIFPSFIQDEMLKCEDLKNGRYNEQLTQLLLFCNEAISSQSMLLDEYLSKLGFYDYKIGLVNNSMEGSVQDLLIKYCEERGRSIDVHGVQFTASDSCLRKLNRKVSVYWGRGNDYQANAAFFRSNCLLFEHFLFEPCGTALKLVKTYTGDVYVEKAKTYKELMDKNLLEKVQEYALDFAKDYKEHMSLPIITISRKIINRMFYQPYRNDALLIGNLWDEDVEGVKQICDFTKPTPRIDTIFRRIIPGYYGWDTGFFVVKQMPKLYLLFWRVRVRAVIYLRNYSYIYDDLVFLFQSLANALCAFFKQKIETIMLLALRIKLKASLMKFL